MAPASIVFGRAKRRIAAMQPLGAAHCKANPDDHFRVGRQATPLCCHQTDEKRCDKIISGA
jgi:hypothetical protein